MRPFLILTALLALIVGSTLAADKLDHRATTIHLDKAGTAVSVAPEGAFVRLMLREATKDHTDKSGVVVLLSDSSVRLSKSQAERLAELLDEFSEDGSEPTARAKAPWLHLTAAKQCGPGGCSVPRRPAAAGPQAPRQPAATGYSRPRFARRVLRRVGRVFGGRCCR